MGLFRAIEISSSGLTAERLRMDIIANNIANANSTKTENGKPYRRQIPVFEARESFRERLSRMLNKGTSFTGYGVRVKEIVKDKSPFTLIYDPNHPDADEKGYVKMPNVNIVNEMVDMISATRAYEANVTALNAAKEMAKSAFEIGR